MGAAAENLTLVRGGKRCPAAQHILLLFIDGLGIGRNDPANNPCTDASLRYFRHFLDDRYPKQIEPEGYALGLDACLDVPGLPQSATGQTALLTGINASQLLGRHLNGFPNQKLREVIAVHSILKRVVDSGRRAAFLNTFRPPFFDYDPQQIIRHLSVTTLCNLYAGLPFFDLEDLSDGRSIYQDITGDSLRQMGFEVPLRTPEEAGTIVGRESQNYHFSLFEYFQTDRAGHGRDPARALAVLQILDRFLGAVLDQVDRATTLVLLTSDHGNIEDLAARGHTRNPVMTLLFGANAGELALNLTSIQDVTPALLKLLI